MHPGPPFTSMRPATRGVRMRHASGFVRILAASLLIFTTQAAAQQPETPRVVHRPEVPGQETAPPESMKRGLRDRAELEAFIDGVMQANLREKHVAGATVSVVKDGALFFAKGYGYANVDQRRPVDAERSMFRIGSISKLFTWTAVMQLVEQGKLDLDTDVNKYIDFKIPDTYPQPITLRAIMTHTPGFEEDGRDLFTDDSTHMIPLDKWLATHIPGRVRPPLTYSSYSNYATALAGYIVARASGMSWDDYIEQHILPPRGMTHTPGRQPAPAKFKPDLSDGYSWGGGRFNVKKFEIVNGASPAGSVSASAADMARFMLAHLGNGAAPGGERILAESTAVRMHTRTFGHDPRHPGFALGFYEKSSHGSRIIGHGGDTRLFHSDLALLPSENVGVFVSYNTDTGGELSFGPFLTQFLDHYYPTPPPPTVLPADARAQAKLVVGEYAFNRRSYTTFQKALGLTGDITVSASDSGVLNLRSGLGDMRLAPGGAMLYREELGDNLVSFKAEGSGPADRGFLGLAPMMTMDRVSWNELPKLHWVVLGGGVLVFLSTLVAAGRRAGRG